MADISTTTSLDALDRQIATATQELATTTANSSWWSPGDAMTISATVLIFGAFTILVAAFLVKSGKTAESILRMFGTILIVIAALFLVVAGYSDQQIAPVMGLLGTIAGYLLGKDTREGVAPARAGRAVTAKT